ncbi:MAG: hypothetical protein R3Y07_01375 [Eubacteriales bacterium]
MNTEKKTPTGKGPGGPNPKDAMKNRLPVSEMKTPILEFLSSQKELYIAVNNDSDFPELEVADYRMNGQTMILILTPASMFLASMKDGDKFTGFIFDKQGSGLKMTKRVYGKFTAHLLSTEDDLLKPPAETDPMMKKMLSHGAKFFRLTQESMTAFFSGSEIFTLDQDLNPSFAEFSPNGKKRYENSRHILMEYEGREVIFNTFVEGNLYYTLTKLSSNKISYIKQGGECKFFDGRDNHFTSKVELLDEEKTQEIFDKLVATNSSYFKSNDGLVGLCYKKQP